jgi:hypothetical protein
MNVWTGDCCVIWQDTMLKRLVKWVGQRLRTANCCYSQPNISTLFVTVDRNLSFQNKVINLPLAVIVLCAPTNRLVALRAMLPQLLPAIEQAVSGHVVLVS